MANKNKQKQVEKKVPTILDFLGEKVNFDKFGSQYFWGVDEKGGSQMIAELRGWGAIQNLFPKDLTAAEKFQDELGYWIADAINQKIQKEKFQSYCELKKQDIDDYAESLVYYNICNKEDSQAKSIMWHAKKFQGLELPMDAPYKIGYGKLIIDVIVAKMP